MNLLIFRSTAIGLCRGNPVLVPYLCRDFPCCRHTPLDVPQPAHQEPGAHVVIAVADNGPGIPPEQREKVFVPFFTTKRQGSGVGLTLVRQIATAHGATVNIIDSPDGGTRVRVRF
jgi:signal transduction histidine kinase